MAARHGRVGVVAQVLRRGAKYRTVIVHVQCHVKYITVIMHVQRHVKYITVIVHVQCHVKYTTVMYTTTPCMFNVP